MEIGSTTPSPTSITYIHSQDDQKDTPLKAPKNKCEEGSVRLTRISRTVKFSGNDDFDDREKLAKIERVRVNLFCNETLGSEGKKS